MPVPFEQTPLDELKAIVEININATLRVTQAVLPKLIERLVLTFLFLLSLLHTAKMVSF